MSTEQPRGDRGRFASKCGDTLLPPRPEEAPPLPPRPEGVRAQERRLEALRAENGGLVIKPPAGIENARMIYPSEGQVGDGQPHPNAATKTALGWFKAIADLGGTPNDLQLAWELWRPTAAGVVNPKYWARAQFDNIVGEAGRRFAEQLKQLEDDALPDRVRAELRTRLVAARARAHKLQADWHSAVALSNQIEAELHGWAKEPGALPQ